jgi:membrane-associated phospholipid phosphatase
MELIVRLLADGALVVLVALCAAWIILTIRRRFWASIRPLVMAGLTSLLAGKLMSLLYQPAVARPFLELGVAPGAAYIDNPGFPSDHALLATAAVVAFYAVTKKRRLTVVFGFVVIAMSIARVIALVHTPLDVAGGIVAGLAGALWYRKLTKS